MARFDDLTSNTFTLFVTKSGTGTGTVTSDPAGIDCGSDCSEAYPEGTPVDLTAAADAGSVFTGWGGVCVGCGTKLTCVRNMNKDKTCDASFNAIDLTGRFLPNRSDTDILGRLKVMNAGAVNYIGPVNVDIYTSMNETLDPGDHFVVKVTVNLQGDKAFIRLNKYNFPEFDYIIAVIDPDNLIPEIDETNNNIVGP